MKLCSDRQWQESNLRQCSIRLGLKTGQAIFGISELPFRDGNLIQCYWCLNSISPYLKKSVCVCEEERARLRQTVHTNGHTGHNERAKPESFLSKLVILSWFWREPLKSNGYGLRKWISALFFNKCLCCDMQEIKCKPWSPYTQKTTIHAVRCM